MHHRRWFNRTLAALAIATTSLASHADNGTLRIVIGFPAGATLDVMTRLLAEKLQPKLGRTIIVDNRAGAGGAIADQIVKDAPADGSTLLIAPVTTLTMYPHSHPELQYDPIKDFTPILHIARFPYALGTGWKVPARTLAEYGELIKKDPQQGFFASAGVGSATHYYGLMYAKAVGGQMTHVPYKGTSAVLLAVQSGELPAGFVPLADMATLSRANKAHMLAIIASERNPAFPDVPTFKESGYDMTDEGQYALFGPAKLPKAMTEQFAKAMSEVLQEPDVRARFQAAYLTPTGYDGKRLGEIVAAGYKSWGPIIKSSNFQASK